MTLWAKIAKIIKIVPKQIAMTEHELSVSILNEMALSKVPFSVADLHETIIARGGILRIGICKPVREYFYEMVDMGFFKEIPDQKPVDHRYLYLATERFLDLAAQIPHCVDRGLRIDTFVMVKAFCAALKEGREHHQN